MTNKLSVPYLESLCHDGWWPYIAGHGEAMEATAWCAIACRKNHDLAAATIKHIISSQLDNGGWTTAKGIGGSDWSTAPALLTLGMLSKELGTINDTAVKSSLERGFKQLTALRTDLITDLTRVGYMVLQGADYDYARGWPWEPNTYHWVEPTSYAILAIKSCPYGQEARYKNMVDQACKYMLEKTCSTGGWNFGSASTLGTDWPPLPSPTALALIAMHDKDKVPFPTGVNKALSYLRDVAGPPIDTTIAESLAIIARDLYGDDTSKEKATIAERFSHREHLSTNLCSLAAAIIASRLSDDGNPFRFS
jgi:hypothetical protein